VISEQHTTGVIFLERSVEKCPQQKRFITARLTLHIQVCMKEHLEKKSIILSHLI